MPESLVSTRTKRANAGGRLKKLLREEKAATGITGDEDIDLLFQEDDEDAEFNEGDEVIRYGSDGEVIQDAESEEEQDEEEKEEEGEVEEEEGEDDQSEAANADSDEMFSDSEDSDASEDSDVGEKELQRQERQRRKEKLKKSRQIPQIKKPAIKSATPKIKKKYTAPEPDTLLSETRRQSSRSTVVQNKLELVEKLREEEARRATLKPVHRVHYVELTQEEKLEEALETEKYNTSTLNKYQEQEIEKKKKQRALQLSRRKKLHNVVSFTTLEKFVTILEEHEYEKFLLTRDKLKKKDRRGRKSDKQKREELEAKLTEERRRQRLKELEESKKQKLEADLKVEEAEKPEVAEREVEIVENDIEMKDEATETKETMDLKEVTEIIEEKEDEDNDIGMTDVTVKEEVKTVKFTEEIDEKIESSRDNTVEPEVEYEGPLQKVGINLISFENKLKVHEIKDYLFGNDSNLGPSRRFKDLEPLIRIQKNEDELKYFQSLDSKLKLPDFQILEKYFPKFGEFNKIKTEQIIPEETQDIKVQLSTPAPTGIYLPNGNKKICLITGKPAMYFDPKTGMPYSSVESYKVIKSIQEGKFAWGDFRLGGGYFEDREEIRHAKGVPEGFDV